MEAWLLGIGGTFLILFVMLDVIWSTLSASGGGPYTNWFGGTLWKLLQMLYARRTNHSVLQVAGVLILLAVVGSWIVLVFSGWLMIFSINPNAIVEAQTVGTASFADRVYYLGFIFLSLGMGDFVADSAFWRVLSVVACINGLSLLTLSITYLVPIISAVTTKRQLAEMIAAFGSDPVEVIENEWNGRDFRALEISLNDFNGLITQVAQRYLAYPVLHYFHSPRLSSSVAVSLARLDEALTILQHGVKAEVSPDPRILRMTRHAIDVYIRRIAEAVFFRPDDVPPIPNLDRLRRTDLPMRSDEEIAAGFVDRREHRSKLLAMVRVDGWEWAEGCGVKTEGEDDT